MRVDLFVKQRLRDGGIVNLAVSVAAIANQVNHHVAAELVAILRGHARHTQHRFRIFRIHVEDRNRLALGQDQTRIATYATHADSS